MREDQRRQRIRIHAHAHILGRMNQSVSILVLVRVIVGHAVDIGDGTELIGAGIIGFGDGDIIDTIGNISQESMQHDLR